MDDQFTPDAASARPATGGAPDVVVVGSASRDLAPDDPRGWRLGGSVTYGALTAARLGLRTGAIVGVDGEAADAAELGILGEAGVDVRRVRLSTGPVFDNIERPDGRLQLCHHRSAAIPVDAVPAAWETSPGWILAPVAAELSDGWAAVPSSAAFVALGWQGLLRRLVPGEPVRRIAPSATPIVRRADLVGVSRDDLEGDVSLEALHACLRPGASLVITRGDHGGLVADGSDDGALRLRHYPALPSHALVDPTGAGDVFLAALAAARIQPRLVGGRLGQGFDLLLAAAAASLVLEGPGLHGVATRDAVRARMAEGLHAFADSSHREPGDASAGPEPTRPA
jgi:sugar/nucleoside kinase (ribokinase family)